MISCVHNQSCFYKTLTYASGSLAVVALAISIIGLLANICVPGAITSSCIAAWYVCGIVSLLVCIKCISQKSNPFIEKKCVEEEERVSNEEVSSEQSSPPELEQAEVIPKDSFEIFADIPDELTLSIFSFLNPKELGRCFLLNRKLKALAEDLSLWQAFDLKKISPEIKTFDENDWVLYASPDLGLDTRDLKPLNNLVVIPELFRVLKDYKIENNAGITLLTVPKNQTLAKLENFSQNPLRGRPTRFVSVKPLGDMLEKLNKTQPTAQTYRVIVSNGLIEGTKGYLNLPTVNNIPQPDVLTYSTFLVTSTVSNNTSSLFVNNERTYIWCSDRFPRFTRTHPFLSDFNTSGFQAHNMIAPIYPSTLSYVGACVQFNLTEKHFLTS